VDHSNDWGKWRRLRPCGRSWPSTAGPSAPAWMRAARDTSSISSTRSMAVRSIVTTLPADAGGFTPPTTDDPPPNGTTMWPASLHQSSTASRSRWPVG
jgi:hypothetical protein